MGRIWAVTSGSGGAGKSSISLALALTAAKKGIHTLLLDASSPCRSCDLYLGMQNIISFDLTDAMLNQLPLSQVTYPVPDIGHLSYACVSLFSPVSLDSVFPAVLRLSEDFELTVIDLASRNADFAAIGLRKTDTILLAARPDMASLRLTEALAGRIRRLDCNMAAILNFYDRRLVRKGFQYERDTMASLLDLPVLGIIEQSDLFYTLRTKEDEKPILSYLERAAIKKIFADLWENGKEVP